MNHDGRLLSSHLRKALADAGANFGANPSNAWNPQSRRHSSDKFAAQTSPSPRPIRRSSASTAPRNAQGTATP